MISVCFNFFLINFSYSKSISEISIWFYAEIKMILSENKDSVFNDQLKMCYCKVKLFQNHEAEWKHFNNVKYVIKIIIKLQQQIIQAVIDSVHFDKQKRNCFFIISKEFENKKIKNSKHKKTLFINLQNNLKMQKHLHMKLIDLHNMFSSKQLVSTLNLRENFQNYNENILNQVWESLQLNLIISNNSFNNF